MNEVEFTVNKKIGTSEFEIPVEPDDLMELLHEATFKGKLAWEVDGNGINFYYDEDIPIGSIHYWECKNEPKQEKTDI